MGSSDAAAAPAVHASGKPTASRARVHQARRDPGVTAPATPYRTASTKALVDARMGARTPPPLTNTIPRTAIENAIREIDAASAHQPGVQSSGIPSVLAAVDSLLPRRWATKIRPAATRSIVREPVAVTSQPQARRTRMTVVTPSAQPTSEASASPAAAGVAASSVHTMTRLPA